MEQISGPPARFRPAVAMAVAMGEAAGSRRIPRPRTPDDEGRPGPVLDAARSMGVIGPHRQGALHAAGPDAEPDAVRTITPPLSPGSHGGVTAGRPGVTRLPGDTARSFTVGAGFAPGRVTVTLTTVDILHHQPELPGCVRSRVREPATMARDLGLRSGDPAGAVVPVVLGPPEIALRAALICAEHGVRAGYLRSPSVPVGRSCPRLTARANLSSDDLAVIRVALTAVAEMKVTR